MINSTLALSQTLHFSNPTYRPIDPIPPLIKDMGGLGHGRLVLFNRRPALLLVALVASLAPAATAFHGLLVPSFVGPRQAHQQQRQGRGFFGPQPLPTTPLRAIRGIETFGGDFTLAPEVVRTSCIYAGYNSWSRPDQTNETMTDPCPDHASITHPAQSEAVLVAFLTGEEMTAEVRKQARCTSATFTGMVFFF